MAEKIKVDVCMAQTEAERRRLVVVSTQYWKSKGYRLLNDEIGPDSIKVYHGRIDNVDGADRYRPETIYAKEPLDEPAVLIFIKS